MSKKSFRVALSIVGVTAVIVTVVAIYLVLVVRGYPTTARSGSGKDVSVTIERGMAFPKVAARLHDREVIDRPLWFRLYAMKEGVTTKVRVGTYTLKDNMTPEEVLQRILEGVPEVTVSVTIPEGIHMLEVFEIVEKEGVASRAELEKLARDPEFLSANGINAEIIDGYLFPETYRFKVPTKPSVVLTAMVKQHRTVWEEVRRENKKSIEKLQKKLGWSERDILIMASIVEKEAVAPSERPRIAQVFINRLVSPKFVPHRLDTDPTIRYGCTVPTVKSAGCAKWKITDRLRRAQLDDRDNPYNTYQHEGLPPGPICNPGRAALEATANPDGSGYFFFVSRNDGTHVFSKTRAEHERAVDKYQR